jgi:hypothetical protein
MAKVRTPIYAFNGGEISRRLEGRSDLDGIYDRSAAAMVNFVATVEGPATKRPGFRYIKEAMSSASWLSRFVFNTTQTYVLEWGDKLLRFYTNGGRIELEAGPYELPVPYRASEASRISTKQSFDRLYMAHGKHFPGMLTRQSAVTFNYDKIPLTNGPFKDYNADKTLTLSWAGGTGDVGTDATVTANFGMFQAGHVGAPIIFQVESFASIKAWEPNVKLASITIGELRKSDGKVYELVDKGGHTFTGTVEPTHTTGDEWDGSGAEINSATAGQTSGALWRYRFDRFGIGTITAVTSPTVATVHVTRALPTLATATHLWAHSCFSDVEGYPQLVGIWGGRLIFVKGVELIASVVGDYFNMSPIDDGGIYAPDMAFRLSLSIADPPTWLHADKEYLLLGSHSEEIVVGQVNPAAGISATNVKAQPQSTYGSADVWPAIIGTSVLFVQRGARKIREAVFSYEAGRFVGDNIAIYARQVTRTGLRWFAWQQEPESILWSGRTDGVLVAHPHNPEQSIKGFSRHELAAGNVISGVSIASDDGQRDDLWILAALDGAKAVMKLGDFWDEDAGLEQADSFFVDWGVSYDGNALDGSGNPLGPRQTFTQGLAHLGGRQVRVLADGAEHNNLIVGVDGHLTLPKPAMKVHIGLGYAARIKLLRAEARGTPTLQGLRKRAQRLFARLIDSAALTINNRNGTSERMFDRPNSLATDTPPALFNGDTNNVACGSGSDFSDAPELVSDNALPSTISLLVPTYEIEEPPQ